MPSQLPDYSDSVRTAVADYWDVRRSQADESEGRGVFNTGIRAEVTGGRHLHALQELVVSVFVDTGIPAGLIDVKRRPIAGYFRRDKSWDVVVMVADRVVGIIELKSMAGDSPGQNYNNRTDEAPGPSRRCLESGGARHCRTATAVAWLLHAVGGQRGLHDCSEAPQDGMGTRSNLRRRQLRGPVGDLLRANGPRAAAGRSMRGSR